MISNRDYKASQKAINLCKGQCVICGWNLKNPEGMFLVQGCHIKDYAKDRSADVFSNIIALCPNHHIELDSNCFYIDSFTRNLFFYDTSNQFHGKHIEIEYVKSEYLAYRQYKVMEYWKKLNNNF